MAEADDRLVVIWSSGDREVALEMVFMYALNSRLKGWWGEVTLVVWGPSARLLAGDAELQQRLRDLMDAGVRVEACKRCADDLGVASSLEALGIDVRYMGAPLTGYLKEGRKVITF